MADINLKLGLLSYETCPLCHAVELHFDRMLSDDALGSKFVMKCDYCESESVYRASKELVYYMSASEAIKIKMRKERE